MTIVHIPGTDLHVSALCLGAGHFGTAISADETFTLLNRFVELGGSFIDTANVYGDWVPNVPKSVSEKTIGKWMKDRGCRHSVVIGTKGGHYSMSTPNICRVSAAEITHDLDQSLNSLQTDFIDLYWLHRDDPTKSVAEIIDCLEAARGAGKIRWYGASNWSVRRIAEANAYAASVGASGFRADQVMWNVGPLSRQPYGDPTVDYMSAERFKSHVDTGMAEIPYQSQANGLFSRMHDGTIEKMVPSIRSMYREEETRRRYERICRVCSETGLTISQVVLGYLKGQPFATIPIIGSRNLQQLDDSMTALDVKLTPEMIAEIGDAPHRLSQVTD